MTDREDSFDMIVDILREPAGLKPDLTERVTLLTFRRVQFPQAPVILTLTELDELAGLLPRWLAHLKQIEAHPPASSCSEPEAHDG